MRKLKATKDFTNSDGKTELRKGAIYEGEVGVHNRNIGYYLVANELGNQSHYRTSWFEEVPAEEPAISNKIDPNGKVWLAYGDKHVSNLTVRGIFAAIAMLGQSDNDESPESIADTSVKIADALINRLNRDVE